MMKKLLLVLLAAGSAQFVLAQVRGDEKVKIYLEGGAMSGKLQEKYKALPLYANYPNNLNYVQSDMKFRASKAMGYNAMIGYYIDRQRRFAIQTGAMYYKLEGTLSVDSFHIEYQSTDYKHNIFRQVVTANGGLHENVVSEHVSVPLMARYNVWLADRVSLNVNAGIMYNTWMTNNYTTKPSFDYEAIYQFEGTGSNLTYHYDNNPTPDPHDWLITRQEYAKDNPKGNVQDYFDGLKKIGYTVGLHEPALSKNSSGKVNYRTRSLGYAGQLELGFLVTKNLGVKAGVYYIAESFSGKVGGRPRVPLTNKPGDYHSMLTYVQDVNVVNYGASLSLAYNFYTYSTMRYKRN